MYKSNWHALTRLNVPIKVELAQTSAMYRERLNVPRFVFFLGELHVLQLEPVLHFLWRDHISFVMQPFKKKFFMDILEQASQVQNEQQNCHKTLFR